MSILLSLTVHAEKVLKYSEDGAPTNMDPVQSATIYANQIVTSVYDTLFEYKYLKRPFELKPNLAVGMPEVSKDGKTYTFKIKKGVHYIDDPSFKNGKGREVVAQDFVYSIKRHFDPKNRSQGSWLWQGKIVGLDDWGKKGADYSKEVEGLKALDKYTIQIKVTQPFAQLLYTLAMGFSAFVPKEAVEKYGKELSIRPVGSGPFKLVSHNSKKTVLAKNPKYRKDIFDIYEEGYDEKKHGHTGIKKLHKKQMPIVDKVEVNWMKEVVTRWNSFTKGNEIVYAVLQNEYMNEVLQSKSPVKLKKNYSDKYFHRVATEAGFVYNNFNMDHPKLGSSKDPKENAANRALRCAVRKSFSWPKRIERFYLGLGQAYPGVVPPMVDGYDENLSRESVTQDLAGAKKLLKEHGWNKKNLPKIEYAGVASLRHNQFFAQFRGNLIKIGYPKNKIKNKTFATFGDYNKAVKQRKTDMIPMGWGLDYPDAENTLGLYYGPNASPGSNSANYDNPEFNKLFKQASLLQPGKERTELYKKMNKMVIDDCVTISAFSRTRVFMWHKKVAMWPQRDIINSIYKYVGFNN